MQELGCSLSALEGGGSVVAAPAAAAGGAVDAKSVSWNIPLADEGMELMDSAREP